MHFIIIVLKYLVTDSGFTATTVSNSIESKNAWTVFKTNYTLTKAH